MVKARCATGWIDEQRIVMEMLTVFAVPELKLLLRTLRPKLPNGSKSDCGLGKDELMPLRKSVHLVMKYTRIRICKGSVRSLPCLHVVTCVADV